MVVSNSTKKEYKKVYELKVLKIQNNENSKTINENFKILCNITHKDIVLKYGDKIKFTSNFEEPPEARNKGGFDYKQYLKTKKILGVINVKADDIIKIGNDEKGYISKSIHNFKNYLIEKIKAILPQETAGIGIALLLGDKSLISEETQNSFRESNLSHALAISGAHISYILLGITNFLKVIKLPKKFSIIFSILFLIFFMMIVGFTPSVTRSCIMAILTLSAEFFFRKSDVYQNLAISSIFILLINPYYILDIGFQLSYGGTIGIILFMNKINLNEEKNKKTYIEKIKEYIKQILKVSLAANIIILPIMIYHFNTLSATFLISNLLASPILGIILIFEMIFLVFIIIFKPIAQILSYFLNIILQLFIQIAKFCSNLPFSQILLPTPKIWQIILYYFLLFYIYNCGKKQVNREKPLCYLNKYKKIIIILLILLLLSPYIFQKLPIPYLTINFIDVGQGDSILIQTPSRKTILIDGGGSELGSFDVGEKTLLPYLLDKNIMKIDYMMYSHFDADHASGLLTILENLKVTNIIISKQGKLSEKFKEFLEIVKNKNVNIIIVKAGDRIVIDKQCHFDILFPTDNLISENILNNNSIVAKFNWQNHFSMLLTGDIEKIAETKIIEKYKNSNALKCNIIKISHHGSKGSSTQEFLKLANPEIALIGVGKTNTFGHPNEEVLERLKKLEIKIYRTDINGEITLKIAKNGKIKTKCMLD